MSWRDDAAPPVQGDLDLLAEEAPAWAKRFLAKGRGTLVPFAVRLLPDEKTDLLFVDPSEGDGDPTPDAVMDVLYELATVMRQRGVAIVSAESAAQFARLNDEISPLPGDGTML